MRTLSELKTAAASALAMLKAAGSDAGAVDLSSTRQFSLKTKNSEVELLKESVDMSLNLRVFAARRFGGFATSDLHPDRLRTFVQQAVEMVKLTDEDPLRGLPPPERTRPLPTQDLAMFDPALAASVKDRAQTLCQGLTASAQGASPDVMHVEASFGETHHRSVLLTTDGFEGNRESTRLTLGCSAYVKDGDRKQSGYDYRTWRSQTEMSPVEEIGRMAARRALDMKGARPLATGDYPLVIVNYWGDKLTEMLMEALDGATVFRKLSCLGDKVGKRIAGPLFTLTDDPLLKGALGSRHYDSEGMVAQRMPIIEQGVLKNCFFSAYWGRKAGQKPTTAESSNLVFAPGKRSGEQMVATLDHGLFVTDFIGGNFNALSGDFSAGIKGFLVEKGKIKAPVAEMNLAGNLLTVLPKVVEMGNDPYPYMSIRSPAMRFSPITVSGT